MICVRKVVLHTSFLLLCLVLVTGCWDRTEINDLALVMGSGLDIAKNGQLLSTLQIALPPGHGALSQGGGQSKPPDLLVMETGMNGNETLSKLQALLSRKIFLGHRVIIVIGEEYARHGINNILDTLLRSPLSRYNCYILTAHGTTAKEVLQTKYILEQISSVGMTKIQSHQCGNSVKIGDFINNMSQTGVMPITGAIRIVKRDGNNKTFRIDEAAVYRDNKLQGFLSDRERKMLPCSKGTGERISITTQMEPKTEKLKGTIGFELSNAFVNVNTKYRNGRPSATVTFQAKARVLENDTNLDLSKNITSVNHALSEEVRKILTKMIDHSQKKWKADIFGIGEQIHKHYPYEWKKIESKWDSIYPSVPISIRVDINLERIGRTTAPAHLQQTDIKSTK